MLYNRGSVEIEFREKEGILNLRCISQNDSGEFREALEQALAYAAPKQLKYWLLDLREIGTLSEEEESWLQTVFFPNMIMQLGSGNFVALVLSGKCYEVLLQEAGKFGLQSYNSLITFHNFCDMQEAQTWLQQQRFPHAL